MLGESIPAETAEAPSSARRLPSRRSLLIGAVVAALVLAVGIPAAVITSTNLGIDAAAREDAATITKAHDAAQAAAGEFSLALSETAEFSTATLGPAVAAVGDGSQFSPEAATQLAATLEAIVGYQPATEEPVADAETAGAAAVDTVVDGTAVALSAGFGDPASVGEVLAERYHSSDDHDSERVAAQKEADRLSTQASDLAALTASLSALVPQARLELGVVAEAGAAAAEATVAAHDRAGEDLRAQLTAQVTTLREYAAAVTAGTATEEIAAAEIFTGYTAAAESVRASHTAVVAAEEAAARNASRGGGNGGRTAWCDRLNWNGMMIIVPC